MTSTLTSALQQQVENLSQLAQLLEQELHLISARDAEALTSLLEQKAELLEAIQAADRQIEPVYQAEKKSGSLPEEAESLMQSAAQILDECKYKTSVNQKAVEQGQLRLTHLRNLMLEVRAKESLTYDKKGKPNGGRLGLGVSA